MRLALMAYSFANQIAADTLSVLDVIAFTRAVGLEAIELMDDHARDEAALAAIAATLAQTGTRIACYDIHTDFAAVEPAARAASVAAAQAACGRAARLGAPHVLIVPGPPAPGQSLAEARQHSVAGLRACLPEIRRLGLTASIPNLGEMAAAYGQVAVVGDLLAAVGPGIGLTYDVGNWLMAGEDPLRALDQLAPRVAHVHLKDWRVEPDRGTPDQDGFLGLDGQRYLSVALGDGIVDLAGALRRLARLGYPGYLAIEYEGTDDPAPHLRRGVEHARRLLDAARADA